MDSFIIAKQARLHALEMLRDAGSSHIGSNFSIADILAVLYSSILNIYPSDCKNRKRDRFFLSKGHATAILYSVLCQRGFFPAENLKTFYKKGSPFLGHAHQKVSGVELSTGSLGHALSVAVGVALAAKMRKQDFRTFVLLSDGELDEGSNWEAILFAAHNHLSNLYVIIDYNKIQSLDYVEKIVTLEPLRKKWEAFNWEVVECDGHDHIKLREVFTNGFTETQKPHVLIAHTIKGKGVSFMENTVLWHYRSPQGNEFLRAKDELDNA